MVGLNPMDGWLMQAIDAGVKQGDRYDALGYAIE
jgi:hypothetical protein